MDSQRRRGCARSRRLTAVCVHSHGEVAFVAWITRLEVHVVLAGKRRRRPRVGGGRGASVAVPVERVYRALAIVADVFVLKRAAVG